MIVHDVQQGSPAWFMARLGIPTASQFHRILSPTGKPSSQAEGYLHQLVAERLIGQPCASDDGTAWMARGADLEAEAIRWYEFTHDVEVVRAGFLTRDDRRAGCSPDGLVDKDGMVQIKCPSAAIHAGYLLDSIATKYRPQVQGELWVAERAWLDFVSYCPGFTAPLNAVVIRVVRDEEYAPVMEAEVLAFADRVAAAEKELRERMMGGVNMAQGSASPLRVAR
jgi:hypothetical protein